MHKQLFKYYATYSKIALTLSFPILAYADRYPGYLMLLNESEVPSHVFVEMFDQVHAFDIKELGDLCGYNSGYQKVDRNNF